MTRRPSFIVELRAEPRTDPWRALKAALKALLRNHGLKCVAIKIMPPIKREELRP